MTADGKSTRCRTNGVDDAANNPLATGEPPMAFLKLGILMKLFGFQRYLPPDASHANRNVVGFDFASDGMNSAKNRKFTNA